MYGNTSIKNNKSKDRLKEFSYYPQNNKEFNKDNFGIILYDKNNTANWTELWINSLKASNTKLNL